MQTSSYRQIPAADQICSNLLEKSGSFEQWDRKQAGGRAVKEGNVGVQSLVSHLTE
jgi:hypothetical protein